MAYQYGNLAVKPKRKEQEEYIIRETKKKVVRKKPIPAGEKVLYLAAVLLAVIISGVIIFRYADIYYGNLQAKQINSEMKAMTIEVEQLQREVQTLSDPERIREFAESLGMVSSLDTGIIVKKPSSSGATAKLE
ncbi:cell division protein FtsL [Paenibacillus endoradicis]|uniref:cell division protein FtsL n=1 Tax=Paenibacillus endoradicis TaxID=2972487 RepID=UPI002158B52F|nr:septum formation initiator family protein [Paenibacillus endoradicis]MCR8655995.1 cell division initiation protein [Paenibacillus endoradicis]MCR8658321.1 cell division initiation protein [Paenibacillus endoradicis]